jgi:hypothetical protein
MNYSLMGQVIVWWQYVISEVGWSPAGIAMLCCAAAQVAIMASVIHQSIIAGKNVGNMSRFHKVLRYHEGVILLVGGTSLLIGVMSTWQRSYYLINMLRVASASDIIWSIQALHASTIPLMCGIMLAVLSWCGYVLIRHIQWRTPPAIATP